MLLFHQIANDPIVEILHRCPVNAFPSVFLLLLLQHQLDEELLQFFVAVIDAELLEAVGLKDLKTINVQYTNDSVFAVQCGGGVGRRAEGLVDLLYDPREESFVDCLNPKTIACTCISKIKPEESTLELKRIINTAKNGKKIILIKKQYDFTMRKT